MPMELTVRSIAVGTWIGISHHWHRYYVMKVTPPIWWGVAMLAKIQLGKGLIIYKVGLTQSNQLKPALFLSVIANRCPMILLFS